MTSPHPDHDIVADLLVAEPGRDAEALAAYAALVGPQQQLLSSLTHRVIAAQADAHDWARAQLVALHRDNTPLHDLLREKSSPYALITGLKRFPFTDADPAPVNALRGVAALGLALVDDVAAAADHLATGRYWLDRANICTPSAVFQTNLDRQRGSHGGRIGQLIDLLRVRDGHTLAALVFLLELCGSTPRRVPGPNVQVLLDRGWDGQRATLQFSVLPTLPSGLAPDPRTMAWFSADRKFQVSLETAWSAAASRIKGTVLWSLQGADDRLVEQVRDESLGAAFTVLLDELRRLRRPILGPLTVQRIKPRTAIVGRVDPAGPMLPVSGYRSKLSAIDINHRVVVPTADREAARAAAKEHVGDTEIVVPVRTWRAAAKHSRRLNRSALLRLSALGLVVLVIAVLTTSYEARRRGQQAAEQRQIAQANAMAANAQTKFDDDIDDGLLLAVEAWKLRDTPETRSALLAGLVHHRHLEQVVRPGGTPHRVALSPDETRLAVFSLDQNLLVWDLERGEPIAASTIDNFIEQMSFDQEGQRLALVTPPWDPTTPNQLEIRTIEHLDKVTFTKQLTAQPVDVEFVASTDQVMLAHPSGIEAVNVTSGAVQPLFDQPVSDIAVGGAGKTMMAATGGKARIWDLQQGIATHEVELAEPIHTVGLSSDEQFLALGTNRSVAVGHRDGTTVMVDLVSGNDIEQPASVVPYPDGSGVLAALKSGKVLLWDAADLFTAASVEIDVRGKPEIAPPVLGQGGRRVATTQQELAAIWRPDRPFLIAQHLAQGSILRFHPGRPEVQDLDYSPDGQRLLSVESNRITVWDTANLRPITQSDEAVPPCAAVFDTTATSIISVEPRTESRGPVIGIRNPSAPSHLRSDHEIDVPGQFRPDTTDRSGSGCDEAIAITRDGQTYAVGTTLRRTTAGTEIASGGSSIDTAFFPTADKLASTSNGKISILDIRSGENKRFNAGRDLWGIAVGPDGMLATGVTTANDEGSVMLWSPSPNFHTWGTLPRYQIGTREAPGEDPIRELAFSPDGHQLATGSLYGWIVLWTIDPPSLIHTACRMTNRNTAGSNTGPSTPNLAPACP